MHRQSDHANAGLSKRLDFIAPGDPHTVLALAAWPHSFFFFGVITIPPPPRVEAANHGAVGHLRESPPLLGGSLCLGTEESVATPPPR